MNNIKHNSSLSLLKITRNKKAQAIILSVWVWIFAIIEHTKPQNITESTRTISTEIITETTKASVKKILKTENLCKNWIPKIQKTTQDDNKFNIYYQCKDNNGDDNEIPSTYGSPNPF